MESDFWSSMVNNISQWIFQGVQNDIASTVNDLNNFPFLPVLLERVPGVNVFPPWFETRCELRL